MQSFDRLRMMGKRLRMKVLVDEDRLEDEDAIALSAESGCPLDARLLLLGPANTGVRRPIA